MLGIGKTEFMQSYYKDKALEIKKLIDNAGFECEFVETTPDENEGKRSLFKRGKKVPKRHGAEEKIFHVYVKKKEYDDIVEALKKNA